MPRHAYCVLCVSCQAPAAPPPLAASPLHWETPLPARSRDTALLRFAVSLWCCATRPGRPTPRRRHPSPQSRAKPSLTGRSRDCPNRGTFRPLAFVPPYLGEGRPPRAVPAAPAGPRRRRQPAGKFPAPSCVYHQSDCPVTVTACPGGGGGDSRPWAALTVPAAGARLLAGFPRPSCVYHPSACPVTGTALLLV